MKRILGAVILRWSEVAPVATSRAARRGGDARPALVDHLEEFGGNTLTYMWNNIVHDGLSATYCEEEDAHAQAEHVEESHGRAFCNSVKIESSSNFDEPLLIMLESQSKLGSDWREVRLITFIFVSSRLSGGACLLQA